MRRPLLVAGIAMLSVWSATLRAQSTAPRFLLATADSTAPSVEIAPDRYASYRMRVTLNLGRVPRREALRRIGAASSLQFVYANDLIAAEDTVRLDVADVSVAEALADLHGVEGLQALGQAHPGKGITVAIEHQAQNPWLRRGQCSDGRSGITGPRRLLQLLQQGEIGEAPVLLAGGRQGLLAQGATTAHLHRLQRTGGSGECGQPGLKPGGTTHDAAAGSAEAGGHQPTSTGVRSPAASRAASSSSTQS